MNIPFQDLARLHRSIESELTHAVERVISSSGFVGGDEVALFEEAFANTHDSAGAAGCGSGTDALALALRAAGIGAGDEVIVPSMTFVATAEAVVHSGAAPVIADVDPTTLLLSPESVAEVRTTRTRAIVPVHLYGNVVPFDHLQQWRDSGLVVIEDAAQAHLATWEGRSVGAVGHCACFSFYPGKNLGAWGDGGAVMSRDTSLIEEVKQLRDHGRRSKYAHEVIGWCSRLDGLQAAILAVKLRHLPEWTANRRVLAERYHTHLGEVLVPSTPGSVHHLQVMRTAGGASVRDQLRDALAESGIATGVHYPIPLSRQPSLSAWPAVCKEAEAAAQDVVSLPMDPLMSTADVDVAAEAVLGLIDRPRTPSVE